jgi:hypothetical protein
MTQVTFSGATGTISNLNQNFTQLYLLRELVSDPGYTAATPKFTFGSNYNLGIGIAPSAWGNAVYRALDIGAQGGIYGTTVSTTGISSNSYFDGANSIAKATAVGCIFELSSGTAAFYTIASVSAGAVQTLVAQWRGDSSGNFLVVGAGALGYGTGSGGTVTQATSKSTGVTLNKSNGTITMNGAALNATTSVSFVLTNSLIAATDVVNVAIKSGATLASYFVQVDATAAGSCTITVRNYTAGNLSEAIVMSFAVLKGVAA